jgi:hypothetical protein
MVAMAFDLLVLSWLFAVLIYCPLCRKCIGRGSAAAIVPLPLYPWTLRSLTTQHGPSRLAAFAD